MAMGRGAVAAWFRPGRVGTGRGRRAAVGWGLVGAGVLSSGPLKLKVGGSMLEAGVVGADCRVDPRVAKSGSSGNTMLGTVASSGKMMVGIGGVEASCTFISGTLIVGVYTAE